MLVVNAMNTNSENIDILQDTCVALLNLSADADEQVLEEAKVIETVINMMRNNPEISKLQEQGLGVLQNLSMRTSAAKREIAELGFPRDATVVAILRDEKVVVPRGETILRAGDEVMVLVTTDSEDAVRQLLVG